MDEQEKMRKMREFIEYLKEDPVHGLHAKMLLEDIDKEEGE